MAGFAVITGGRREGGRADLKDLQGANNSGSVRFDETITHITRKKQVVRRGYLRKVLLQLRFHGKNELVSKSKFRSG